MIGFEKTRRILENKIFIYVSSRYITYAILFVNSLLIAKFFGPSQLAVWGFLTLMIQYLNQLNLGISHSASAIISVEKENTNYVKSIVNNSLTIFFLFSLLVVATFIFFDVIEFKIGEKYGFDKFKLIILAISIITYFNTLFSNVYRVYGLINEIIFNQSAFPILMLISIIFFKGESLLWALLYSNLVAFLISLILFVKNSPLKIKFEFNWKLIKLIQKRGFYLFLYNSSFYLIMITTRTAISERYKIEEFGFYTFAYNLSSVILLLVESISFLIFPKIVNKMAVNNEADSIELFEILKNAYVSVSHLLAHIAVLLIPFFIYFFQEYNPSLSAFRLTTVTIILYTNTLSFVSYLIAKQKEMLLGFSAFLILIVNLIALFIATNVFKVDFSNVIISTFISNVFFLFLVSYFACKELKLSTNILFVFRNIFPLKQLIPILVSIFLVVLNFDSFFFIIPLLLYLILNYRILLSLKSIINRFIQNPNLINI